MKFKVWIGSSRNTSCYRAHIVAEGGRQHCSVALAGTPGLALGWLGGDGETLPDAEPGVLFPWNGADVDDTEPVYKW